MPYISNMFYIAQMSADKLVLVLSCTRERAHRREKGQDTKGQTNAQPSAKLHRLTEIFKS
jgi:hypothetical protein